MKTQTKKEFNKLAIKQINKKLAIIRRKKRMEEERRKIKEGGYLIGESYTEKQINNIINNLK